MCECLLEEPSELESCELRIRTTDKLGLDALEAAGWTPQATAATEICAAWREEEEQ